MGKNKNNKRPNNLPKIEFAKKAMDTTKMQCNECGFVYDPLYGDPESNVEPYTNFVDIDERWECPICDNPKSSYKPLNIEQI